MVTETTTPSATASKVAHGFFAALSMNDLDAAMGYFSDETVYDVVPLGEICGKPAICRFYAELRAAFADYEMTVERVITSHSTAVVQWRAGGTFSGGQFQGVAPTGKHVDIRGVDVMDVAEGRIRHNTTYYDGATFARQIGLLPRSGSGVEEAMLTVFNAATRLHQRLSEHTHGHEEA